MTQMPRRSLGRGPIAWMASNPVAANLIMVVLLVGGLLTGLQMKQEVFPEFDLNIITVTVAVPGATPEEVEKGVVQAVEEAVQGLDGVDEVSSISREGSAVITIEAMEDTDGNRLLQDVKAAVDRITTFPKEAESPEIALKTTRREVLTLVVTGSDDPLVLREWAETIRDELAQNPGITQVELDGVRDHEVLVDISQDTLRRYGLTLQDIATRISETAIEQGSGTLRTPGGDIMLRLNERREYAREFASIAVAAAPDGSRLLLEDIAEVHDGFEDSTRWSEFNGRDAILIDVYRIGKQSPESVATAAKQVIDSFSATMPGELSINILRDDADVFRQRAHLLISNAVTGVALVFLCLALFLEPSLAFWVSLGIPVSVLGSFMLLMPSGISVNMMSMFAFIITLGIVVDDAIVVGENVATYRERGASPLESAILGTREVGVPVIFSVLTNMITFLPMLFIPGVMGNIWGVVPTVVCAVFACSLTESLFVLPAHLAHSSGLNDASSSSSSRLLRSFSALQQRFSRGFLCFVERRYGECILKTLHYRYLVLAGGLALLLVTLGYVASGRLGFDFMPRTEADFAYASASLPTGASRTRINEVKEQLVAAGRDVVARNGGEALSTGIYAQVKDGEINIRLYLVSPDARTLSTAQVTQLWRDAVGTIPGVETLSFEADKGGPGSGKGLTVRLSHRDTVILEEAAQALADDLSRFANARDVDTGTSLTKRQFEIRLLPIAEQLGLTAQGVASQVRNAFEGATALRQQRNRNEITVRVRLPEDERNRESAFEDLILRTPSGQEVLLRDVTERIDGRAYSIIRHTNGRRTATVSANVSPPKTMNLLLGSLKEEVLPDLMSRYPGLSWEFGGRQADMQDSTRVAFMGFLLSLLGIYALLAIPFKSYTQPMIIMTAIPFGIVGAVGGHLLMGYSLSVISLFGVVALAGVVVNDSLVLVDFANRRRLEGLSPTEAIRQAGIQRFRPILLTTLTTFAGLAPIIFETSRQARQLIPVALSLGFGILFATVICLIFVPALYLILEDVHDVFKPRQQ